MKLFVKENMEAKEKVVLIVSAELTDNTPIENINRTNELELFLIKHKIPHKKALGSYKDVLETSFVIVPRTPVDTGKVLTVTKFNYGQESILVRRTDGEVGLLLLDTEPDENPWISLGDELRCVPAKVAGLHDGWTKVDDKFYVVVNSK